MRAGCIASVFPNAEHDIVFDASRSGKLDRAAAGNRPELSPERREAAGLRSLSRHQSVGSQSDVEKSTLQFLPGGGTGGPAGTRSDLEEDGT